jgi:hypothetical protein
MSIALYEVTQMRGGLAYMTALPDCLLRAGIFVMDITGRNVRCHCGPGNDRAKTPYGQGAIGSQFLI